MQMDITAFLGNQRKIILVIFGLCFIGLAVYISVESPVARCGPYKYRPE